MNPDTYHARVRTRGSDAGRLHAPQLVLELTDLVPQPGRHLELQLGRGHVHLLGELLDQLDQVVASRATALAGQVLAHPGTGDLPRLCCRPAPPMSSSVSASSRTSWSRMSAIFLRSGCGSMPCSVL